MRAAGKTLRRCFLLVCVAGVVSACNLVDNQQAISYQDELAANPLPLSREFSANNAAHKVLLAIIDSGVDYNHPVLAPNIHFDVDPFGKPTGAGFDFVGQDHWPSPYLVRTAIYDPESFEEEREAARKMHKQAASVLQKAPELARFLDLQRNVTQELRAGAFHGTHVAGLMVYDRPDFGLRSYRVLPQNKSHDPRFDYAAEAVDSILEAIRLSASDGARVVNLSLGVEYAKAIPGEDSNDSVVRSMKFRQYADKIEAVIRSYPQVLFVAAAGNEGKWRDAENLTGIPCGLKLPNVLCVGALRESGDPASFTNLVNSGADVVFALGVNVLSTLPVNMCISQPLNWLAEVAVLPLDIVPESFYEKTADAMKKECPVMGGFGRLSGTSMAAPLVSHLAAEILAESPLLDAAGVIRAIYAKAVPSFIGTNPVYKLKVRKPSWYEQKGRSGTVSDAAEGSLQVAEPRAESYWESVWAPN